MPRNIIIDTDPGIDDAVAILLALASPELAVLALVAVAGNLPLAATSRTARALLELAGRSDIPVYDGCPRPLAPHRIAADAAHGAAGLGDLVLPEPRVRAAAPHGVSSLIDRLSRATTERITLCALGPLTNIAAALVLAPQIAAGIDELVIMGGGSHGNTTAAAEFNMHADPQAAAIVFASGVPITLVPLDLTETVRSTAARVAPIGRLNTRCGAAAAELLGPRRGLGRPPMAMHDPCVVGWLVAPELFAGAPAHVAVETASPLTLGMTVIDRRRRGGRPPNARVLDRVDVDALYRLLAERLARLP